MGGLAVYVDGQALPEEEARALWQRFSDWMEEHRGDLAGFAAKEGYASVHPGVEDGRPVLHASRTAAQRPYAAVGREGGSEGRPGPNAGASPRDGNARKSRRNRRR